MTRRGQAFAAVGAAVLLAAGVAVWYWTRPSELETLIGGDPAVIARLEEEREKLRRRIAEMVAESPVVQEIPPGNVVVGMPIVAATELVQAATTGFLDEIELVLRNIKVHKDGDIKVRKGLLSLSPGHYVLDLNVDEAHAVLKPGPPQVSFKSSRFGVSLPVKVVKGEGRTTLGFKWDSQGLADLFCDDFEILEKLEGSVPPSTYQVDGAFHLEVAGGRLVASPHFPAPGIVINLSVEPSEEAWKFVEKVVAERPGGCESVLKKIDLRKILSGILSKGFKVTVPSKIFKPFDLPAGLEQNVTIEGKTYALSLKPTQLKITPDVLWYGSEVDAAQEGAAEAK